MKKLLLLFLLLISCSTQAQKRHTLRPFEDYTNCTTGFLNEKGDTIWPAQFDRVEKPILEDGNVSDTWIALFQGKWGLLSNTGTILLPFDFTEIQMTFKMDVFLATKERKTGIFRKDGTVVYPMEMEGIETSYRDAYVFRQNGKMGLLDSALNLAMEPIYNYIEEYVYSYYQQGIYYDYKKEFYYLLEKDEKFGLADEKGKVLFDNACCPISFVYSPMSSHAPMLTIQKPDGGIGLITLHNEILIEPEYNDLYLSTIQNSQGDSLLYAFAEDRNGLKKIFLLDNKKESKSYEELLPGSHALLFQYKKKQGILNADLEEQLIKSPYELRFGTHRNYFEEEYNETYYNLPFVPGSNEKSVLVLADTEVKGKSHYKVDKQYGLINVLSGAKVKPRFQNILAKSVGEKTFYFAFDKMHEEQKITSFEVFNSALEIVDTFSMDYQFMNNYREFFRPRNMHLAFVFRNSQGKMGAIGPNGKILIPFIYDELRPQYSDQYDRTITERLAARIGQKNGVIDWNGKVLIPVEYDYVQAFSNNFQIAAKPGAYALYDSLYRPMINDCQYIANTKPDKLKYYQHPNDSYLQENAFYAVKKDTAYVYFKEGFKPLNEEHLNHHASGLTLVAGRLLLEPSGKCLLYKDYIVQTSPKVYYFLQRDSLYFYQIEKGVTVSIDRSSANPNIDGFIHVNQYPLKEGLVSKETGEWVLEPKDYFKILSDGKKGYQSNTDHFWYVLKSDEHNISSIWTYHRIDGGPLAHKFDLPIFNRCGNYSIARSGGKYGLLDNSYAEVLPFAYKNIVYSGNQFFLKGFDNRWSVWSIQQGILPLNCSDIALHTFTNGRLIFDDKHVAVLSNTNEILFPFTAIKALPDTLSLSKLLGQLNYNPEYHDWRMSILDNEDPLGRVYNNKTILDLSIVYSTRHQLTEIAFISNKTVALNPVLLDPVQFQKYEKRGLTFKGKRVCSYSEIAAYRTISEYLKYNNYTAFSSDKQQNIYHTLVLEGNQLREATLAELFLENFNYDEWLDTHLTEVINKKQLFGLQCMNLPQVLQEYKKNFHLEKAGISFNMKDGSKSILFRWVELKGLVKEM